jgi:hypothetical protein
MTTVHVEISHRAWKLALKGIVHVPLLGNSANTNEYKSALSIKALGELQQCSPVSGGMAPSSA